MNRTLQESGFTRTHGEDTYGEGEHHEGHVLLLKAKRECLSLIHI